MPTGVRRDYIIRRLERDGRHDLAEAIREDRVSAYSIAVSLGWTRRAEPVGTSISSTNAAKRRQYQLRALTGEGLSAGQMMELQYGPSPSAGSLFGSREELENAWQRARERLLEQSNPGRRPAGFYEFEFDGRRPPYDTERSVLWRMGLLSEAEKVTLEREWRQEFQTAQAPDFTVNDGSGEILVGDCARAAHYAWADIPRELVKRWSAAVRRRRARQPVAPSEEVAATK
jgi:hypothetical protein